MQGINVDSGGAYTHCAETLGHEPVQSGAIEVERIRDMISSLEKLSQAYRTRVGGKMGRRLSGRRARLRKRIDWQ
jgi:hypothetical protein